MRKVVVSFMPVAHGRSELPTTSAVAEGGTLKNLWHVMNVPKMQQARDVTDFGYDSCAHESDFGAREKGGVISCLGRDVGLRSARSWPVLGVVSASGVLQVLVCTVCLS